MLSTTVVKEAFAEHKNRVIDELIIEKKNTIPPLSAWEKEEHEISLARQIRSLPAEHKTRSVHADMLRSCLEVLLILCTRGEIADRYGSFEFTPDFFHYYPINIFSLESNLNQDWRKMSLISLVEWLLKNWGITTHIHVALNKLSRDRRDTFRVKPSDRGLIHVASPEPIYTTPRFRQALQVLHDIGAIKPQTKNSNIYKLTGYGRDILNEYG